MVSSDYLSAFVYSARIAGLASSGIVAGFSLGASWCSMQAIQESGATPNVALKNWNTVFDEGAKVAVPLTGVASLSYFALAYKLHQLHPQLTTVLGLTQAQQLLLAAVATFGTLPYTFFFMLPSINNLKSHVKKVEYGTKSGVTYEVDRVTVDNGVELWKRQTYNRTIAYTFGFLLAVTAF